MTREWEAAVRSGDVGELRRLLEGGADIDARDRHGQTGLMIAAGEGRDEVVGWFIERGASLDATAKYGLSALMLAAVRGHRDVMTRLVEAGADVTLRGTGAPGFAGKTAEDLAREVNPHFQSARSFKAARGMVAFIPREPGYTAKRKLESIRIYVRDHKMRELAVGDRTLEAYYGGFSVSQARRGAAEARRLALEVSYGREPKDVEIGKCAGRMYELGAEPEPDDIDGRMPAVVTWHDGEMHYLVASHELGADELVKIARSLM